MAPGSCFVISSSDVKPGRAGLVLGWVTTFKQKRSFFSHYHSFSLVLKHRKSVHFRNVIQSYAVFTRDTFTVVKYLPQ